MIRSITLLLLSIAVVSCTPATQIEIYNNTGREIVLETTGYGGVKEVARLRQGKSLTKHWGTIATMKVADNSWRYTAPTFVQNEKYWIKRIGGGQRFRIQIERDGHLFALHGEQKAPTNEIVDQPAHYPISPKISGKDHGAT